jgi:hypothetical protein
MRTTLTIDDALLRQLRQKALDSGKPFKQVVNDTLRAGLKQPAAPQREPYRCPSFSMGQPRWPVNLDKATALADALVDEELVTKLRQGL